MAITALSPDPVEIACAQLAPVLGDLHGNRARAAAAIRDAAQAGARLVVLPELCTTGYALADESQARELGETVDGQAVTGWCALARECDITIVAGFLELDRDGAPHNSAAVVDPGGLRTVYRKTHLWDREQLVFRAGAEPPPVIDTPVGRVGVAICYDAFFPEVMRGLALAGAEVIAVPMNSPLDGPANQPLALEVVLAVAAAQVNRVFVAQADRCGPERGIEWAQATVICDPDGRLLAAPAPGTGLRWATCDLILARDKSLGVRNDVFADRRTDLYRTHPEPSQTKEKVN